MKKSEEAQCHTLEEVPKRSSSNIGTLEVLWAICKSFMSVLLRFLDVASCVAPNLGTHCLCWRCWWRLLSRSTKFLASTDCPWFVRWALRVLWSCWTATSRTRSLNLLVCCSCILIERLSAVVTSTYLSNFSEQSGNCAVRYWGAVSILLGCSSLCAWGIVNGSSIAGAVSGWSTVSSAGGDGGGCTANEIETRTGLSKFGVLFSGTVRSFSRREGRPVSKKFCSPRYYPSVGSVWKFS